VAGGARGAVDRPGALILAALLAALLVPPVVPYDGPAWEVAAGLGHAACCALVLAFRLGPPPVTAGRLALHRAAGNAALGLAAAHVAVMAAADPFVPNYLGWLMPTHVLAGALGAAALLAAVATREPALRLPARLRGGRRLHAWAGVAAAALAGGHALDSSARLGVDRWRWVLLACALAALLVPAVEHLALRRRRRRDRPPPVGGAPHLLAALVALTLLLAAAPTLLGLLRG
jgi:hypothetical protein